MKDIVEDLLKLIYAYQAMHSSLGITGEQSPSVLRAEEWLAAQQSVEPTECTECGSRLPDHFADCSRQPA